MLDNGKRGKDHAACYFQTGALTERTFFRLMDCSEEKAGPGAE